MSRANTHQELDLSEAKAIAAQHLAKEKHWAGDEYRLEPKGTTKRGLEVIWAIYLRDERQPVPGAGNSVILHVDTTNAKVTEELAFQ